MLDTTFRPLKDRIFNPICQLVPSLVSPLSFTILAFFSGILCCYYAAIDEQLPALCFWVTNRALDCLDGALARHRQQASDLGGFLDLLGDFIIYGLVPISCASSVPRTHIGLVFSAYGQRTSGMWLSVSLLEMAFFINNFVLFYIAAVIEKRKAGLEKKTPSELTSLAMKPALIEGFESGVFFTIMLAWPQYIQELAWLMAALVFAGTAQRVTWLVRVL